MKTFFLRGVIPAFVLSIFFSFGNFGIQAQSGQVSSDNSQSTATLTAEVEQKTKTSSSFPEISSTPKIDPVFPALDFSVVPHNSKLNEALAFEGPDVTSKTAPRSFKATAYSLRGRTASGVETRQGVVAADPRVLPLGSLVHIKAGTYSGVYTVQDTGSAVKGNLVDVWMPSTKEARQFGRRSIKLQVIRYGPITRTKKSK